MSPKVHTKPGAAISPKQSFNWVTVMSFNGGFLIRGQHFPPKQHLRLGDSKCPPNLALTQEAEISPQQSILSRGQ